MSERIHALAQRLFGKASVEECDVQEVKNLAQRFPYFAPAQFLLLEKLKQENSSEYPAQLQKAILYYHNPLEFQYFISSDRFYTELTFNEETAPTFDPHVLATNADVYTPEEEQVESFEAEEMEASPRQETSSIESGSFEEMVLPASEAPANAEEKVPAEEEEEFEEPLAIPEFKIQSPPPEAETQLSFEPFHTVDYFASQGIKLSQEGAPKDKFDKQLRSFTEWLKTMKRLPPTQLPESSDAVSVNKVQGLAEDSIHDSNILTETMAEVWLKQGNTKKAIEVYNKLSLLNPSKKAYFATKIENLKRS